MKTNEKKISTVKVKEKKIQVKYCSVFFPLRFSFSVLQPSLVNSALFVIGWNTK